MRWRRWWKGRDIIPLARWWIYLSYSCFFLWAGETLLSNSILIFGSSLFLSLFHPQSWEFASFWTIFFSFLLTSAYFKNSKNTIPISDPSWVWFPLFLVRLIWPVFAHLILMGSTPRWLRHQWLAKQNDALSIQLKKKWLFHYLYILFHIFNFNWPKRFNAQFFKDLF